MKLSELITKCLRSLPLYFGYLGRFYIPDNEVMKLSELITKCLRHSTENHFLPEVERRLTEANNINALETLYHLCQHELLLSEEKREIFIRKLTEKTILRANRKLNSAASITSVDFI